MSRVYEKCTKCAYQYLVFSNGKLGDVIRDLGYDELPRNFPSDLPDKDSETRALKMLLEKLSIFLAIFVDCTCPIFASKPKQIKFAVALKMVHNSSSNRACFYPIITKVEYRDDEGIQTILAPTSLIDMVVSNTPPAQEDEEKRSWPQRRSSLLYSENAFSEVLSQAAFPQAAFPQIALRSSLKKSPSAASTTLTTRRVRFIDDAYPVATKQTLKNKMETLKELINVSFDSEKQFLRDQLSQVEIEFAILETSQEAPGRASQVAQDVRRVRFSDDFPQATTKPTPQVAQDVRRVRFSDDFPQATTKPTPQVAQDVRRVRFSDDFPQATTKPTPQVRFRESAVLHIASDFPKSSAAPKPSVVVSQDLPTSPNYEENLFSLQAMVDSSSGDEKRHWITEYEKLQLEYCKVLSLTKPSASPAQPVELRRPEQVIAKPRVRSAFENLRDHFVAGNITPIGGRQT